MIWLRLHLKMKDDKDGVSVYMDSLCELMPTKRWRYGIYFGERILLSYYTGRRTKRMMGYDTTKKKERTNIA